MRAHIVENGVVVNTIEVESLDFLPNLIAATNGGIGDLWDGVTFTAPPLPEPNIPQQVTMRQARLALLGAGLLAGVDAAIASLPSPQKEQALIDWEFAATVDRNFGMVPMLASALGLTETQIDDLFIQASAL